MWPFKKKKINTPLENLILAYGKNVPDLLDFARCVGKPTIEDICLEDIKTYYKAIVEPQNARWLRESLMKAVRKFFMTNRGQNVLKWREISDNPLDSVARNDILPPMPTVKKKGKGRPAQVELIKKVISLREKERLSFRAIARALDRDLGQVHVWYKRRKILLRSELSTG